jgi:chorismate dehydratase
MIAMDKIRISAVSYYNTLPLIYGILNSGLLEEYELKLDVPSACARSLKDGFSDISLIPVGALPGINGYQLIGNYCIGASGNVKTVLLLTNSPLKDLKKIYLDTDSLTSVNLVKILAKRYWHIEVEWVSLDDQPITVPGMNEGVVLIGDKTFGACQHYKYCHDLAGAWFSFTGLPFVFAAWATLKELPETFISQFDKALSWGVNHKKESILLARNLMISESALLKYLENDISFSFDADKRKGLELFLSYFKEDLMVASLNG